MVNVLYHSAKTADAIHVFWATRILAKHMGFWYNHVFFFGMRFIFFHKGSSKKRVPENPLVNPHISSSVLPHFPLLRCSSPLWESIHVRHAYGLKLKQRWQQPEPRVTEKLTMYMYVYIYTYIYMLYYIIYHISYIIYHISHIIYYISYITYYILYIIYYKLDIIYYVLYIIYYILHIIYYILCIL